MSRRRRKPSAAERRVVQVRNAFDADALIRICTQQDFSQYATRFDLPKIPQSWKWRESSDKRFYYYADRGADVLAVAHLDHVQANGDCVVVDTAGGLMALSGALDDRLGAYVILEMLPKLNINVDILLTTDEECGASTAAEFFPEKDYKWMIEFDRGGTDVVMYDYEHPDYTDLLAEVRADVGVGSYSDISVLEHLGVAGFNWGVGYREYHSKRSHAFLEDTFKMVGKFMRFHALNSATRLPYIPYVHKSWSSGAAVLADKDRVDCVYCHDDGCANCDINLFFAEEERLKEERRERVEKAVEGG